jgi:hypothetical protein
LSSVQVLVHHGLEATVDVSMALFDAAVRRVPRPHWSVLLFGDRHRRKIATGQWGAPVCTRRLRVGAGSYATTDDTAVVVRPDG